MSDPDIIILCGGKGTRIAHLIGYTTPKCLAPINGRPFLEHLLARIPVNNRIFLATGHLHSAVSAWHAFQVTCPHTIHIMEVGCAGVIPALASFYPKGMTENVLVMNGDTIFDGTLPPGVNGSFCVNGIPSGIRRVPRYELIDPSPMIDCTGWFTFLDIGTPEGYARAQEILK